ncbi:MAG: hypothetical protein LAO05_17360 [Acidobacteriia bacterium]|nr:hypothetical protein [Terriglobia bacterium]
MTLRLVKAFVWLQWRLLVNGLRGGRRRDSLERFSRWSDTIVPAVAAVLLIPAVLLMAAAGGFAGWNLANGSGREAGVAFVLTLSLLGPLLWLLLRPLLAAGQGGVERGELLRLLPIPASFLRHLELIRAALDPILVLFAAAVLALPLGALIAGRPVVTLVAIVAGALLLAFFASFSAVLALGVQVLLRNRRRGELVTLIFFLALSSAGVVPQFFAREHRTAGSARPTRSAPERQFDIPVALRFFPSGLYAVGLADGSTGRVRGMALNLGALAALAALAYAATATLHRRLLDTPETSGSRATRAPVRVRMARWPGFSPVASATAAAQARTLLRTVRGKMLIISPVFTTVLFALVFTRDMPAKFLAQPAAIAAIAVFIGLANHSSVACNQFAADGNALVLEFLQPIDERDLLIGKLAGSTVLFAGSLFVALAALLLIFPSASPVLLLAVLAGGLASHFALAPVNALLAAFFPKTIDLGKLGKAGKPHSTAALVSFIAQAFAMLPAAACIVVPWFVLRNLALAPLLAGAWAIASWFLAVAALSLVARAVRARRENLAMVASGR